MATRTVEPYSMAFVTAPNTDVAKKIAGGVVRKLSSRYNSCFNYYVVITLVIIIMYQ